MTLFSHAKVLKISYTTNNHLKKVSFVTFFLVGMQYFLGTVPYCNVTNYEGHY